MDDVLDQFQNTLIGTNNDSEKDFEALYKNWGRLGNQEERRKEILAVQKSNRTSTMDKLRGIMDFMNTEPEKEIFKSYRYAYRPNIYVAGFTKTSNKYRDVLMKSEWMVEKPADFNENWCVVPCPKGLRSLVIANEGITRCYTKYGVLLFACNTELPGGNSFQNIKNRCCILDCFYDEKFKTMYVLDILAWNIQNMTDGETEFRRFWLETQFAEIMPAIGVHSKKNKIKFSLLPMVPCTPKHFNEFMMKCPQFQDNYPKLDGLLFYHKRANYVSGETPLVGWLFPYMVPEIIGPDVTVHPIYIAEKPENYVNQATFIQSFEEKSHKKQNKSKRTNRNSMDTAHGVTFQNFCRPPQTKDDENKKMDAETTPMDQTILIPLVHY